MKMNWSLLGQGRDGSIAGANLDFGGMDLPAPLTKAPADNLYLQPSFFIRRLPPGALPDTLYPYNLSKRSC